MAEVKINAGDFDENAAISKIQQDGVPPQPETPQGDQDAPPQTPPAASPDNVGGIEVKKDGQPPADDPIKKVWGEIFGDMDPDTAKNHLAELRSKAEQPKPVEFANDYLKGLNEYLKAGGTKELYDTVVSVDVNKLAEDPIAALTTAILWENPGMSKEDVELAIRDKYRQLDDDNDNDKRIGIIQARLDAKGALEKIREVQKMNSIEALSSADQNYEIEEGRRIDSWKPVAKKIVDSFNSIDIEYGEGQKLTFTEIGAEDKAVLLSQVMDVVKISSLVPGGKDEEAVKELVRDRIIARKFRDILSAVHNNAETIALQNVRNTYDNGEIVKKGDQPPGAVPKSAEDALFEREYQRMGGR